MNPDFTTHWLAALPLASPGFVVAWHLLMGVAVVIALLLWRRREDRTYLYYGLYVGLVGVMSLTNFVLVDQLTAAMGEASYISLNNFVHLSYAFAYLVFVKFYFQVGKRSAGWSRFYTGLEMAYGVTILWWLIGAIYGDQLGGQWMILSVNFVTLISSLILAIIATHGNRPGAREFLYASLPLTVCGLILVAQFLADAVTDNPGLLGFRAGFLLHVMIFLIALSVRSRELRTQERGSGRPF